MAPKHLASVFVVLALVGGTLFFYAGLRPVPEQVETATIWTTPRKLPEFTLTEHTGQPFSQADFGGQWSLVFFGFTHCPDICPATLQQLSIVQSRLAESAELVPRVILVSVDPERDTPDKLASYVEHFGAGVSGLTGNLAELQKLTSTAGIFFAKSPDENGSYSVDHSAVVLLINSDGAIHASFSAPHKIENFLHDLPIMMATQ